MAGAGRTVRSKVTEHLRAPGQANQVIMLENTAMGLKIPTR